MLICQGQRWGSVWKHIFFLIKQRVMVTEFERKFSLCVLVVISNYSCPLRQARNFLDKSLDVLYND